MPADGMTHSIVNDRMITRAREHLVLSDEVASALDEQQPVVALESTIITHGMSYPENVESAQTSEREIRQAGAVPATVAIIGGRIRVGLASSEIEYMGAHPEIRKASRRDLAMILSQGLDGATTVATTMIGASLAGIPVFATGGIGGAHRHAERTFDISADLLELARTPVAVVCAGAKSILDIGLTLEILETHGVPVIGYRTEAFPAFYLRESGFGVDYGCESAEEIARAMSLKWSMGLDGGMVIANPIPEEWEMDRDLITGSIERAVAEAEERKIRGKEVTPFVLARLHEVTEGKSLASNKQLVYNNARVAAQTAIAYAREKAR
ncbi:MAG: pseudouridine-5'-phosphate glycosidase [bacterium]